MKGSIRSSYSGEEDASPPFRINDPLELVFLPKKIDPQSKSLLFRRQNEWGSIVVQSFIFGV